MTGYFRGTLKVIDIILNMRAHYVENAVLTRESYLVDRLVETSIKYVESLKS